MGRMDGVLPFRISLGQTTEIEWMLFRCLGGEGINGPPIPH